eukprot:TRINITY_DN2780_c0_g2_i1.p1 TRINITY_DN2780_c0_g2~~TRINITY_DN2780_c0_g2_i1.p1  ORF type:complete len:282 (+),score=79.90 TRINITY_DN2780_c0_g2_i1:68-847(+)
MSVDSRVTKMLGSTGGRDQIMSLLQYLPGVMDPVTRNVFGPGAAESMEKFAGMCGTYRGITRLQGLYLLLQGKAEELASRKKPTDSTPVAYALRQIKWFIDVGFYATEAGIILTKNGVINKNMSEARMAQLGPRCVWFFFWGLVLEQTRIIMELVALQKQPESADNKSKRKGLLKSWLGTFLWFLVAAGSMPRDGSAAQLLEKPVGSLFSVFHTLMEKTTLPGMAAGPWTMQLFGLVATVMPLAGAYAVTAPTRSIDAN